ncbi:MAG TPA: DoxX family protein [Opitutaceae bacterium]|jgi:putative oxidoreductase
MSFLAKLQALLAKIGRFLQSPVLLVIRLYWGYQLVVTGYAHLTHLAKLASYFESLNIPAPKFSAICSSSTECIGGALLLIGLCSRFAAAAIICVMCTALWTAEHEAVVKIFSDPDKFLGTDPFLFLYAAVLVFAFGPGRISVDAMTGAEK